ncbi:transcription antiterminator lact [Streptococcus bovimastitidis]|uniref:Transcription antiterminator lact n=1 Tax=Streptococcus bovimastitidis TaxID=1856638 RepID=A0A1L8MLD6_9STRE|nr:PRD domain-containing protein [Streptococcus bovimastitidis]OJF71536.1 transcription antiterminator lact [Streptococcus bovimastitidis]
MFRLIRTLNNNAALVKNVNGDQAVVMGLGITFQKKKGDIIYDEKIEKIFSLKNEEAKENFLLLLKDVPMDFISATYDIIELLVKEFHYPVQNYLYVTLTDHIYCSYKTIKHGTYQESRLPDISKEYPMEYQMGSIALAELRKRLLNQFPDDEIARIALHFINAKGQDETDSGQLSKNFSRDILEQIKQELSTHGITRQNSNENYYDRLMVHLTYFLNALDRKESQNSSILNIEEQVKQEYPTAYEIGSGIYDLISRETGQGLQAGEKVYLVLHIQRIIDKEE